jgi:hypothetical protein
VRPAVTAAVTAGQLDSDTIADGIAYEQYVGDWLPVDRHGMPTRHRGTVLKIIDEVLNGQSDD